MKFNLGKGFTLFALLSLLLTPNANFSHADTVSPLDLRYEIDLDDFKGKPFFETMTTKGGIKEKLEQDETAPFTMATQRTVQQARSKFTSKVSRNITRLLKGGSRGLDRLVNSMAGRRYTPGTMKSAIRSKLSTLNLLHNRSKLGLAPWIIAPFLTMASGAGLTIHLDENNYFYNVSYERRDVKAGRSFGAGPDHKADDASYTFYLRELTEFLKESKNPVPFYETVFEILTQSDASNLEDLSDAGQTLATDFITIYTAELYRHVIAGLGRRAPWENDLAEATLISMFVSESGLVQKNGRVVRGTPNDWYGIGRQGSGVGITRRDRRSFQIKVCRAIKELSAEVLRDIERITGRRRSGDCLRGLMEFLNNRQTQARVRQNAETLTSKVAALVSYIKENADDIKDEIQGN